MEYKYQYQQISLNTSNVNLVQKSVLPIIKFPPSQKKNCKNVVFLAKGAKLFKADLNWS